MRYFKIALSIVALIVGALATAMTAGLFNVPPGAIGFVMAGAGFISVLGIQPFALSVLASKILTAASGLLVSVQVWHASVVSTAVNAHPWLWHVVGVVAILAGVLGKSPISHIPPTAADGPLIGGKPPLDQPPPKP